MKKIPMRKCLATGELCPKAELLRVVKTPEGNVIFDYSSRANGHGAYIKCDVDAINLAKQKKVLEKALETQIPEQVFEAMIKEANARKN